jgi:hypothetical protein
MKLATGFKLFETSTSLKNVQILYWKPAFLINFFETFSSVTCDLIKFEINFWKNCWVLIKHTTQLYETISFFLNYTFSSNIFKNILIWPFPSYYSKPLSNCKKINIKTYFFRKFLIFWKHLPYLWKNNCFGMISLLLQFS